MDATGWFIGGILGGVVMIFWMLMLVWGALKDINVTLESIVASQESTYYWVKKMANHAEEGG